MDRVADLGRSKPCRDLGLCVSVGGRGSERNVHRTFLGEKSICESSFNFSVNALLQLVQLLLNSLREKKN